MITIPVPEWTEDEEAQLRAMLESEGATSTEIEATVLNSKRDASERSKWRNFLRTWRPVTEIKH